MRNINISVRSVLVDSFFFSGKERITSNGNELSRDAVFATIESIDSYIDLPSFIFNVLSSDITVGKMAIFCAIVTSAINGT